MSTMVEETHDHVSTDSPTGPVDEPVAVEKTNSEINYPSTAKQALIILGLLLSSFLVGPLFLFCTLETLADIQTQTALDIVGYEMISMYNGGELIDEEYHCNRNSRDHHRVQLAL